jgi:taurine dioxygenase
MRHSPHQPVGCEITDLSLADVDRDTVDQLRDLLARHGVLVFRNQAIDDDVFTAFLRGFGPLAFTAGETSVDGHPDLNVVSNVGRTTQPRSEFHVDTSYVRDPPAYTALRALTIPAAGGETLFSNQYRAYETLPDAVRRRLDGRTITHVATGVELDADAETSAQHPIFRPHPVTGRVALYMSTPARCAAISGLDDAEAHEVVDQLLAHSTRPDNLYRHAWSAHDVVMWDNGCVMHRADHSGVVDDRTMHRGMVGAYTAASCG